MDVDKTTYWLFILFRTCFILLRFDVSANTHPLMFHPWKNLNRRHFVRSTSQAQKNDLPIRISYKLDSWSQYDNPEEGNAREGDIKHYPATRKTITTQQQLLWPDGVIRYFVDDTLVNETAKLTMLEAAMENIMKLTCLKFVRIYPDSDGLFPSDTWVNITGNEEGCYSDLGRSMFGGTTLNLDPKKCFRNKGHALHEILHTLGVFHEHMRPDRDQHITILWENIKEGEGFNFLALGDLVVTNYGLPYDYDSIMHYSMTAFSKNKSMPTIVPKQKDVEIGQRNHLSSYDVQKLLIAYNCSDVDVEYVHKKINQDRSNDVPLIEQNRTSNNAGKNHTENIVSTKNETYLRDSESVYPKSTVESRIPIIWEPRHDFYYDLESKVAMKKKTSLRVQWNVFIKNRKFKTHYNLFLRVSNA